MLDAPTQPARGTALANVVLDLALHPDDAAAFWRAPALAEWRQGRRLGRAVMTVSWTDTPDRALLQAGALAAEQRQNRRLLRRVEPLRPGDEAPTDLPEAPLRVAQFSGEVRWLSADTAVNGSGLEEARLVTGTVQAAAGERAVCRVSLSGTAPGAFRMAEALMPVLRLSVPPLTLAGEAAALAGEVLPTAHLGAPLLPPQLSVEAALVRLVGQLGGVLQHWAERAGAAADPEPVHQLRVATRRLRSALKVFAEVAGCPLLDAAQDALRGFAAVLGVARDWDVFLSGLGQEVAQTFANERAVAAMLRAARRRCVAAYAALRETLNGPAFRSLGLLLEQIALTRPWELQDGGDPAALAQDLPSFGRAALDRRLRAVRRAGRGFGHRSAAELHALRIRCKRLRYAAELFLPCFAGHAATRFMRRLAALQEALGVLNDAATAGVLVQHLGRGHAAGLVRGFAAARDLAARAEAGRRWRRFRGLDGFW